MKFGEKVRDLRKKHSLTQDELAQCLGINKRTIIGWERDGRYPRSIEMLEKMAGIIWGTIYGTITPSTMRLSNSSTFRHIFSLMWPPDELMFL